NFIVIGWAKLVRERIVGWGIARGIFVEPHLIAQSTETQEVVHGLPEIAAERKPHHIARQHNRLAARCPPSILQSGCLLAGEVPGGAGGLPKCDSLHTPLHAPPRWRGLQARRHAGAYGLDRHRCWEGEDFKGDSTRIAARARLRSA